MPPVDARISRFDSDFTLMPLTASNAAIHPDDTIVAISSATGSGKRSIVRVSGPGTLAAINSVFKSNDSNAHSEYSLRRLVRGSLTLADLHSPLPATLYFFRCPTTYTGQDLAEIHTIGSPPLIEQLVTDLLNADTRPAHPGEFTLRAFLAGKKDLAQAEAVNAVIEAGTEFDLRSALKQLAGGVTQPLHSLREDLLNLLADLEAALDFTDEDIEFVGQSETLARINAALVQLNELQQQLDARAISGRPVRGGTCRVAECRQKQPIQCVGWQQRHRQFYSRHNPRLSHQTDGTPWRSHRVDRHGRLARRGRYHLGTSTTTWSGANKSGGRCPVV